MIFLGFAWDRPVLAVTVRSYLLVGQTVESLLTLGYLPLSTSKGPKIDQMKKSKGSIESGQNEIPFLKIGQVFAELQLSKLGR